MAGQAGVPAPTLYLVVAFLTAVTGDLLKGVEVPLYAVAGGRVNVSCMFDLGTTGLYSLKWYHNDTEFYRFVPTDTHRSVDIKPTIKFQVHEVSRTDSQVTLSITSMTSAATGEYKCEVIAEHPSFRTEADSVIMTVLDEAPSPPVITGTQELYEDGDIIKLRCQPESIPVSGPSPSIMWFIQGRPARREYVFPYREDTYSEESGKILEVPAAQISAGGGAVKIECVLKLGSLELWANETLRVRVRHSYLSNYFSAAGMVYYPTPAPIAGLLFLLLFLLRQN
ncbi:uncharacterized protein LOC122252794 [Penaeus japonicus]|uniref:uncharacterized protein LOC122252794 n=1 Tax=Penaeus japonicus TaxID=27405 RepID=UPI001C7166D2|nr:uncharacterized protein LOC122252794 [Penaeus japonicus]